MVPIVDNEVPKTLPKKRKKKVYEPATRQGPRKKKRQNEPGPDESTYEAENILDYSSSGNLESSGKNEAELEKMELRKELWKDKVNFNSIFNSICLYLRKVVSSDS